MKYVINTLYFRNLVDKIHKNSPLEAIFYSHIWRLLIMSKQLLFAALLLVTLAACGVPAPTQVATEAPTEIQTEEPAATTAPATAESLSGELVVYSGRSEALIQPVIDAFKAQHPDVEILLKSGSNSELANALLEEQ